ncbi:N(4)-(beta-N-acetylglucosaminyl)-L-asparaginase [Sphingomonas sp. Leaf407]|uniref:N(4)-(beta-N-acetylglucosaminyl)-L-asparaginase n=1 Tax=unclassified Sphingomonas TaxID=196159 RepID=UPI0006F7E985|nr:MULTISPECIES: N(4)-(beta-N-acetylglucosaminyl)-L-asparaginase [unclassified Sphingomonas]KQN36536.1 N(4)-(beta-N-acetylglucosaminyl)-L-asparaginase [Sphingomonas sp. Leaf42]KQT27157.1 N(4)-(beta-N-acetylglucosaminyl)-L-asparaginase [Sphingomonas sp. Leaf407]
MPPITRRTAIAGLAAGGTAAALPAQPRAATPFRIASTWDFGVAANDAAVARFRAGGTLIDALEAGAKVPEADLANHSVGKGGYPDRDGIVTLDAVIMDDRGHVGAVAALEDIAHPISVARAVMERTPHTFLVGDGARRFALENGFKPEKLLTPEAEAEWRKWLQTSKYAPQANSENRRTPLGGPLDHDTIGMIARAPDGALAGACTTSGMAFKLHGRVGDSPQVGSGLFVEGGVGAATATGLGEEVTRIAGTARVVSSMRAGLSPAAACREAVEHIARLRGVALDGVQVGFLAMDRAGQVGAFALLPGFTYAVAGDDARSTVVKSASLRPA